MKFAFEAADGSVTILGCAPKEQLERAIGKPTLIDGVWRRVLTDEEYETHIRERNIEVGVITADTKLIRLADDWTAPDGNKCYRAAWKLNGGSVGVDMGKARDIHMSMVRKVRDAKLEALDKEWAVASRQKKNAEAEAIDARAQKLRDLPQNLDLSKCETVEQLKAAWPKELA